MKRVLNVGSGPKHIAIAKEYDDWEKVYLDIDPSCKPDVVADARKLPLPGAKFDAVYCSHNLEHYYRHDALRVLNGFRLSLNEGGFAHIRVPDIGLIMREFASKKMDVESILYVSPAGPVTIHDVIYGHGQIIADTGQDFYAHKTGFTQELLARMLRTAGFRMMYIRTNTGLFEIEVFAHLRET